jgi:hypothetical protein
MNSLRVVAVAVLGLAACGGGEPQPDAPSAPTAAPTASASTTADAETEAPQIESKVDLLEGNNSAAPKRQLRVRLDTPGNDAAVSNFNAQTYRVRFKVTNWSSLEEGAYVQLVLDNVPFRPITDLKEKVTLKDLTGADITKGEHILAMFVANKKGEAIKSPTGVSVSRFWVGKKTPSKWSRSRDPLLVVGRPYGKYEGEAATSVLADFYVINAEIGNNSHALRFTLEGPGVKDGKMERLIDEWVPALIWSPSNGEHTLTVELLDPKGKPMQARWNPVVRKFTVSGDNP